MKRLSRKNEAQWRQILKSYTTPESLRAYRKWLKSLPLKLWVVGNLPKEEQEPAYLKLMGTAPELEERSPADPSVASQLRKAVRADSLNKPLLTEAYLEACRKAPEASEGTRRKWRRIIGL